MAETDVRARRGDATVSSLTSFENKGGEMQAVGRRRLVAGTRLSATTACLLAIGLLGAPVAAATPPSLATGNGIITGNTLTLERVADGNTFLDVTATGTLTGTFVGAFSFQLGEVVHGDGSVEFHGFGSFTGTSPCGTGTTLFVDTGSGPATFIVSGHLATVDHADSTASLHSVIDFAQFGPTFTYSGAFHCG